MFATIADVEVDFGPVPNEQTAQVESLIVRAEAQIRQAVPDLDARIAAGRTNETLVIQVISEMVSTMLRNPEGVDNRTKTVGPFTESVSFVNSGSRATIEAGLYLLPRHLRLLGDARRGVYTVALGSAHPPEQYGPTPYGQVW